MGWYRAELGYIAIAKMKDSECGPITPFSCSMRAVYDMNEEQRAKTNENAYSSMRVKFDFGSRH